MGNNVGNLFRKLECFDNFVGFGAVFLPQLLFCVIDLPLDSIIGENWA